MSLFCINKVSTINVSHLRDSWIFSPSRDICSLRSGHYISIRKFCCFFLHNSYGIPVFPDCGNLVEADYVKNQRWYHTKPYVPFRWVLTEPSVHFRQAYMEPSMHFRKTNMEPSMQFRRGNTEFLSCKILAKNLHYSDSPFELFADKFRQELLSGWI